MKHTHRSYNKKQEDKLQVEETFKVKGHTTIYSFDSKVIPDYRTYLIAKNNNLIDKFALKISKDNTITTLGFNIIPIIMSGGTDTVDYCGVGTGSPSSTALGTEVGTRVAITYKYAINNEIHYDTFYGKTDPDSSSNALTEAGLFSATSSGSMYCSNTVSFTKSTANTLLIAWVWSFV